jgi:hypothetical protein
MPYNNKIVQRLHHRLFAPLEWLEQLEQQHDSYCQHRIDQPLPAYLSATLAGVESTLEQMIGSFEFEQQQLFGLIENIGRASAVDALQPRRQRIAVLTGQLLRSITTIRSLAKLRPANTSLQGQQYPSDEGSWDDALRLVQDLSNQLVRYIYTAETTYLPIADQLLGPCGQIESSRSSRWSPASAVTGRVLAPTHDMQSQQLH